jgi:plasmid stabilization system protein ParE
MAKVTWAPSALDDIDSIAKYIAEDSAEMASLFVRRLMEATDRLQEFPLSGRMIPEIDDRSSREVSYGAYRIMYRVEGDEVWILPGSSTAHAIGDMSNHWMKKATSSSAGKRESAETPTDYDFKGRKGVRGKYYRAYQQGHTVRIHREDGTVSVLHYTLEEGAVMLEPDVREYFPTSESVNQALRSLIALIPKGRREKWQCSAEDEPSDQKCLSLIYQAGKLPLLVCSVQ